MSDHSEGEDNSEDIITEEMLWEKIPEVQGLDRANTYYELSARIYARGQYDEALALAETARDIYADLGAIAPAEGLAQAYSAIGYNLKLTRLRFYLWSASKIAQAKPYYSYRRNFVLLIPTPEKRKFCHGLYIHDQLNVLVKI